MKDFRRIVSEELELYLGRFERALARLDDESVWRRPQEGMNSVGNLVLHVEGNIRHFLGLGVGAIPYARDRNAEFEQRGGMRREDLQAALAAVRALALRVISDATDEVLDAPSELDDYDSRREHILHVVAHAGYHAGQAVLLSKLLSGDDSQLLDWGH